MIQCGITYKRISCLYERVGAKKGKILNIYLKLENGIEKFVVAVEKGRFWPSSYKSSN